MSNVLTSPGEGGLGLGQIPAPLKLGKVADSDEEHSKRGGSSLGARDVITS